MDDETGQGAYQGYIDAGFDADKVIVAGFGLAGEHEKDWLMRAKPKSQRGDVSRICRSALY